MPLAEVKFVQKSFAEMRLRTGKKANDAKLQIR